MFVGGLPFGVGEDDVRKFLQENVPNAQKIRVPMNRLSNSIKGIAFVELGSDADNTSVISQASNLEMSGRPLKINESMPKVSKRPPLGPSVALGGRGGYRGGNSGVGSRGGSFSGSFSGSFRNGFDGRVESTDRDRLLLQGGFNLERQRQLLAPRQYGYGFNADPEW